MSNLREALDALMEVARKEGKWFFWSKQSLWFSPDELQVEWDEGRFIWGPSNWELRDPSERLEELMDIASYSLIDLEKFAKKIGVE